ELLFILVTFGLGFAQHNPNMKNGRTSIVHLFEWHWADIAQECERYLAPNGYRGVQISPTSEHVELSSPWHPWWQRYQPIGYKLCSRSGTEAELKDMITRCNNGFRDCSLEDLLDLALEKDYVRGKLHMCPGDLTNVYGRLKTLNTKWFPSGTKPFIYQEVIDLGGEPIKASEYYGLARVTEFKHSVKLGTVVRKLWFRNCGFMPSDRGLVFVDNCDNQRGHIAGGDSVLTFWDSRLYKIATGLILAHPYGVTRVMSSYQFFNIPTEISKFLELVVITPDYDDPDFRDADINKFEAHKSAPESRCSVSQHSMSKAGEYCIKWNKSILFMKKTALVNRWQSGTTNVPHVRIVN
uniref:Amylase alpha 2B n=1 Tax=Cyprinus carpio TaxID=7962 RepID=A0A8C2KF42_CYPCA